jgi:23S rRNA pseudouridine1911/1915/1917 synthase
MEVIFQNNDLAVVNKAIGEDAERLMEHTKPVHRIDMPVSGCVLLARNPRSLSFLSAAFASAEHSGGVKKIYWAIIEMSGKSRDLSGSGEWIHWIKNGSQNKSFAFNQKEEGSKRAVLRYRVIGRGDRYVFLEIELVTGRHHQIRAQLAARGLHIKGDLKYGAKRSEKGGGIRLHAYSLSFPSPEDGKTITVTSLPPLKDNLWTAFAAAFTEASPACP